MAIKFFEEHVSDSDIPLVKDYLRLVPDLAEVFVIKKAVIANKGLMLICDRFKGTYWKNRSQYQNLLEALKTASTMIDECPTLIMKAEADAQVNVGVDEDLQGQGNWVAVNETTFEFKQKKEATPITSASNPFLAASQKSLLLAKGNQAPLTSTPTTTKESKKSS